MARENYNPVPTEAPTGPPPQELNVRATPEAFGAQVGEATQKLGGTLEKAGQETFETAVQFQQMHNATQALNATTGASQELGDAEAKYRQLSGDNATKGFPAFQQQVQQIRDKYAGTLQSPFARQRFLQDFAGLSDRSLRNAGLYAGDQAKASHLNSLESSIKEEQANVVRYTMTGEEPDYKNLVDKTLMYAHEKGLDKDSALALVQKTTGDAMHNMIVARIAQGDTAGASKLLANALSATAPGTDLPLLDASHQAALSQFIQQKQTLDANRAYTEQLRAMTLQDKQDRENAEKAGNGYVTQMLKDPTQVDPQAIANDPSLKYEQKLALTDRLNAVLAGKGQGKDVQTYGAGFWPAYQAVHAPEGDPNRITDPSQLWGMTGPGGSLTLAGVDKLTAEIQGRRTPEGEAEGEMKKAFLSNARAQITGTNEGLHLRDPKGDELYLKFLAHVLPAYDGGKKAGKSAAQLLNPDSPDYVGKGIATFKRPPAQWASDMLQDNAPEPAAQGAIDLTTRDGIVAAYRSGRIDRGAASDALIKGGFATAPVSAPAEPSAPLR